MRFSPRVLWLAMVAACLSSSFACAAEPVYEVARWNARHDLAVAKDELRYYWQVEYPRQRRHLNSAIALTEAEIRNYKERLLEYEPFGRFSRGQPFLVTVQEVQMCLQEAELRLQDLWAERNALFRTHAGEWRALEYKVQQARLRVIEIEAAHETSGRPVDQDNSA